MNAYFYPNAFSVGQKVNYSGFEALIIKYYGDGMWEIRLKSGVACVSGSDLLV